jgi:hypothetical protein
MSVTIIDGVMAFCAVVGTGYGFHLTRKHWESVWDFIKYSAKVTIAAAFALWILICLVNTFSMFVRYL